MLTLTDYTIEKTGFSWVVTIPYDETVPQLRQDEYNLDPIIILEESEEGDNYIKLDVHQCLVSDNGEYILFFCHAWKEQHEEEHEVKSTRGGSRPGSGRPRKEYKVALSVRISPEAMTKLNESTNNKSEFINDLILRS